MLLRASSRVFNSLENSLSVFQDRLAQSLKLSGNISMMLQLRLLLLFLEAVDLLWLLLQLFRNSKTSILLSFIHLKAKISKLFAMLILDLRVNAVLCTAQSLCSSLEGILLNLQ
jgi:hypothetical protein